MANLSQRWAQLSKRAGRRTRRYIPARIESLEPRVLLHGAGLDVDTVVSIEIDGVVNTVPAGVGQVSTGNLDVYTDDVTGTLRYSSGNANNTTLADFFANWDQSIVDSLGPIAGDPFHETRCQLIGAQLGVVVDGQSVSSNFDSILLSGIAHIDIVAATGSPRSQTTTSGGLFAAVTTGSFDDPGVLGIRTDLRTDAPAITNTHVNGTVDYTFDPASPPTYGNHHPFDPFDVDVNSGATPRVSGIYSVEQPAEDLIHNLEHGHVWISYNPALISNADLADLEQLLRDGIGNANGQGAGVILAPRAANSHAIELASWGRLFEMHRYNEAVVRAFIETNRGHAPEGFIPTPLDQGTTPVTFTDSATLMQDTGPIDANAPTAFTTTASGLSYRVLRDAAGAMPIESDSVTVDYRGWLDDGTIFDESYARFAPSTFALTGVIDGWTEGLQLVGVGGMIELWIPPDLGYGAAGQGNIPPNATLHFIIELISIN